MRVRGLRLLLVGAALAGCASTRTQTVDFSDTTKSYRYDDYPSVLEAWTRHAKLVQDVGTVMEVWATFQSWDFRQAYIAKYSKIYDLPEGEREALAKSEREKARAVYDIHLVAQSTNERWNDFANKDSAWRLTLLDGTGAELASTSIKVQKLPDAYESEFFPTRTPFSKTYAVRFVPPEGTGDAFVGPASGRLILRFASPLGKLEVAWEAKDTGAGR